MSKENGYKPMLRLEEKDIDAMFKGFEKFNEMFSLYLKKEYDKRVINKYRTYKHYLKRCKYFNMKEEEILTEEEYNRVKQWVKEGRLK